MTWKSYNAKCLPCDVKYDVIMKLETHTEDEKWLINTRYCRCPPENNNLQCRSQTVSWLRSAFVSPTHSFTISMNFVRAFFVQYLHALSAILYSRNHTLSVASTMWLIHVELSLGYVVWNRILGYQFNKRLESFALSYSQSLLLADFKENHTLQTKKNSSPRKSRLCGETSTKNADQEFHLWSGGCKLE